MGRNAGINQDNVSASAPVLRINGLSVRVMGVRKSGKILTIHQQA